MKVETIWGGIKNDQISFSLSVHNWWSLPANLARIKRKGQCRRTSFWSKQFSSNLTSLAIICIFFLCRQQISLHIFVFFFFANYRIKWLCFWINISCFRAVSSSSSDAIVTFPPSDDGALYAAAAAVEPAQYYSMHAFRQCFLKYFSSLNSHFIFTACFPSFWSSIVVLIFQSSAFSFLTAMRHFLSATIFSTVCPFLLHFCLWNSTCSPFAYHLHKLLPPSRGTAAAAAVVLILFQ